MLYYRQVPALFSVLSVFTLCSLASAASAIPPVAITDTRTGKSVSLSDLLDHLANADVVFLGEQHTDPATHAQELSILQGLHQRVGGRLTLGMEMWERDAQPALDSYLHRRTDEAAFLKTARPWSNYRADYRPLVEYAKTNGIPVLASNVPQAVASAVGKRGLAALVGVPPGLAAALVQAPRDGAWGRFKAVMESMGGAHGATAMDAETVGHFYEAQCVRDETMAETITRRLEAAPDGLVLHVNGQFHSDYGDGIPRRVLWRRPLTKVVIVSFVPVADVKKAPAADRGIADYVVYVPASVGRGWPPSPARRFLRYNRGIGHLENLPMTLTLTPDAAARLRAMASRRGLGPEETITRLITEADSDFKQAVAGIQRGMDDFAAGRWTSLEDYEARQVESRVFLVA